MDLPFDRTNIGLRERPVSSDLNRAQSQIYRTITDLMQQLFGGSASPQSGFIGPALSINALSPAAMSVQVAAGMGFLYNASDLPTDIGATDLEGVDDISPYKPIVLNSPVTFVVPTAPAGPNTRIDIIEVNVNRLLVDSTPREQLDVPTKTFLAHSFYKTLTFSIDGFTGSVTTPAASTAALSYKIGAPGNPGVAPATTPGYIKLGEVHVGSAVTTIVAGNIVDSRSLLLPRGSYLGRQIFTSNGTYNPTPGTSRVRVRLCGGGAGGGGTTGAGGFAIAGGGGGSGLTVDFEVGGSTISGGAVVIGTAGGGGAASSPGSNGTSSTIVVNTVTYTAAGGVGGQGATAVNANAVLGGGGQLGGSSAGDWQTAQRGAIGVAFGADVNGGDGGSSPFGIGGAGTQSGGGGDGSPGTGRGCGGGGGASFNAGLHVGGAGNGGIAIVDEYA